MKKELDFSKSEEVGWSKEIETWNEYKLADGTTLKIKTVLRRVIRLIDQHNDDGSPIYYVNTQNVVRATKVPKGLMGKAKKRNKQPGIA